jgi:hypothetical protein
MCVKVFLDLCFDPDDLCGQRFDGGDQTGRDLPASLRLD